MMQKPTIMTGVNHFDYYSAKGKNKRMARVDYFEPSCYDDFKIPVWLRISVSEPQVYGTSVA